MSLTLGVGVVAVLASVLFTSWYISTLFQKVKTFTNFRIILLGMSITALLTSLINLGRFATVGVPFHSILRSLFLGSFFATIERILKLWEDFRLNASI